MEEYKKLLAVRSELTQEILSHRSSFAERNALFIFVSVLLLLFSGSWFVRYPDVVNTRGTLTAVNGPKEIITAEAGRLTRLLVHNGQVVHKFQDIGWLENSADHSQVIELGDHLDSSITWLNEGQAEKVSGLFAHWFDHLGEIQQAYQQFIVSWQNFNDYMVNGFYLRKKQKIIHDIVVLENELAIIKDRRQLTNMDMKNAEESYAMNQQLEAEKVLSKEELRDATSKYLAKKLSVRQVDESILSNEEQKSERLKELDQLEHDLAQQKVTFEQSLTSLKSSVDAWESKYILRAPIGGHIFFTVPLQESKYLTREKLLGYVVPEDSHYYIDASLSQSNFGKVDTGMKVQVRFDAYPYQQNGYVSGRLDYVSNVASDSGGFLATIRLDKGLLTNDHINLPYKGGLKVDAIIITRNVSLLGRLFSNMTAISSGKSR
jgi:multidrug efflux pump subunit AcrA (membrane-fusion protein)